MSKRCKKEYFAPHTIKDRICSYYKYARIYAIIAMLRMKRTALHIIYFVALTIAVSCSSGKAIRKGEQLFAINEYFDAAKQYRKAYTQISAKDKAKRGEVAWKMAECYRRSNNPQRAAASYQNAIRYKYPDSLLYRSLAAAQLECGEYKAAIKSYEKYLEQAPDDRIAQMGLQTALQSQEWKKNPTRYIVKKAVELNGQRSDYCPAYVGADTTMIMFTSTRKEAKGDEISGITGQKCADFFMNKRDENGKWQKTEKIDAEINSEFEDGACAFTPDGKVMYFTRCTTDPEFPRYAELYRSTRSDAAWGAPEKIIISSDTLSSYAHPAVSPDSEWLYFSSNMSGGQGGFDIWRYYIGKNKNLEGIVENIGAGINSDCDELFPSFGPKGELFFSSNGYPGMGGLDIFCATLQGDTLWQVSNMMAPINSNGDDFGITFAPGLYRGYFSSNRGDARGWDHIYSFFLPETVHILSGWIYEKDGYELPDGIIRMIGNDGTNSSFGVMNDGSYSVRVNPGVEYVLLGTCKGYLNAMQELKTDSVEGRRMYNLNFELPTITRPVLIENIFYEFNKATLTAESATSLDELVNMLELNPNVTIELSSHCDFRGRDEYNLKLSQERAESVVKYLIDKGIDAARLTPVGYGEEKPKSATKKICEEYPFLKEGDILDEAFIKALPDEEQQEICHQLNRRTEFQVLRTTYRLYE